MSVASHELTAWVHPIAGTIPAYEVDYLGDTKYSNGFNLPGISYPSFAAYAEGFEGFANNTNNPDGWTGSSTGGTTTTFTPQAKVFPGAGAHGGNAVMSGTYPGSPTPSVTITTVLERTFTGLEVGRTYEFEAWAAKYEGAGLAARPIQTSVSFAGSVTPLVTTTDAWLRHALTVIATAETHTAVLTVVSTNPNVGGAVVKWDDIKLTRSAYSDFDTPNLPGWSTTYTAGSSGATGSRMIIIGSGNPLNGARVETVGGTVASTPTVTASRTFTGLVPGRVYVFAADVAATPGRRVRLGVGGVWTSYVTTPDSSTFTVAALTHTPTGTTATLSVEGSQVGSTGLNAQFNMDNVQVYELPYTETVPEEAIPGDPIELRVLDGTLSVNDGRYPYVLADLNCWTPESVAVLEQIDPRIDGVRVSVHQEVTYVGSRPGTSADFDLVLRGRRFDKKAGTMQVALSSDELLLTDYGHPVLAVERVYGLAVRSAVEFALAKIGATLEAGGTDGSVVTDPIPDPITNLLTNPGGETNATNWASGGSTTIGRVTGGAPGQIARTGIASISATMTAAIGAVFLNNTSTYINTTAGQTYTGSVWLKTSTGSATVTISLRSLTGVNATITNTTSAPVAINSTEWTRVSVTKTMDATAVRMGLYTSISGTASGRVIYHDDALLTVGDELVEAFSGATVGIGDATYAWTGTAHASTSVKTFLPNADVMIWKPGKTAWSYLEPLLSTTGLRLYCDPAAKWRLVERDAFVSGQLNVSPVNGLTVAVDDIDRDTETFYDSVLIEYADDVYDVATSGDARKTLVLDYSDRPIPAFGAAQAILARALGAGRAYQVTEGSSYDATPGQQVVITVPEQLPVVGVVRAISWSHPDGQMAVETRGLIETPETSWLFADLGKRWQDIPVGIDWTEYTP